MSRRPINPAELAAPVGFAHGWLVEHGEQRTLYLAGQCGYDQKGGYDQRGGHDQKGAITHPGDVVGQLDQALANIGLILRDAGMTFADVVQLNFYVTSRDDYAAARKELGSVWRRHCGKHYPGMAMFEVVSLFDPAARIEVQGIAAR